MMREHKKTTAKVNRSLSGNIFAFLLLIILGSFMIMPMIFVVSNAFKPLDELFIYPPRLFVRHPTMDNFVDMFNIMSQSWVPFSRYIFNTVFITVIGTFGHLVIASLAAFAFAKHKFKGNNFFFSIIVLSLMFTPSVTGIPTYIIVTKLGILDTYWAVLLPALQYSLGIYLMKQFMEGIPDAILESARMDGAGEYRIWFKIAMPMVKPAWITLIILMIQSLWNMISPYTYSEELKTLPQSLSQILAGGIARQGVSAAVSLFMIIVPLVVFIFSQTQIIETMNASGIKE